MCAGFLSLFKSKDSQNESKPNTHHKGRPHSDPFGNLSKVTIPPPVENRDNAPVYRHHTLEENVRHSARGEDPDAEDENEDVLVRHHTLEENVELAKELSAEMRRQSLGLKRKSEDLSHQSERLEHVRRPSKDHDNPRKDQKK